MSERCQFNFQVSIGLRQSVKDCEWIICSVSIAGRGGRGWVATLADLDVVDDVTSEGNTSSSSQWVVHVTEVDAVVVVGEGLRLRLGLDSASVGRAVTYLGPHDIVGVLVVGGSTSGPNHGRVLLAHRVRAWWRSLILSGLDIG